MPPNETATRVSPAPVPPKESRSSADREQLRPPAIEKSGSRVSKLHPFPLNMLAAITAADRPAASAPCAYTYMVRLGWCALHGVLEMESVGSGEG